MDGFSFLAVFGAGVLSFLSPCVLPLVPPYLTYMSGSSFDQLRADGATAGVIWRKSVFTSIFFILGFSIVFITFGATATAFGQAFSSDSSQCFRETSRISSPVGRRGTASVRRRCELATVSFFAVGSALS